MILASPDGDYQSLRVLALPEPIGCHPMNASAGPITQVELPGDVMHFVG
jgi:hypothetical protein